MNVQTRATMARLACDPLLVFAVLMAPPVWWLLAPMVTTVKSRDLALVLTVVVLYPILEELSFRGLLQGWLLQQLAGWRRQWGISLPNLLTSLAFSAAHLPTQSVSWAAATLLPSLLFGHLRERYDRVEPAIALHMYYNAGLILFALFAR